MSSESFAQEVRILTLKMVHRAKAAHIGGALSMTDLLAVLYSDSLRVRANEPGWKDRDRFILSKGHNCTALYATLAVAGFISVEELDTYGENGSRLMAHVSHKVPGVEFSTGSLGHGLPFGCGKALAAQAKGFPWRTFVIVSDGELNEGSNWEAILFAAAKRLEKLTLIVDYNKIQSLGRVEEVLPLEPLAAKLRDFGWMVKEIDGHDHDQIREALSGVPWQSDRPTCILAHTVKGKGVQFMEDRLEWHYKSPSDEQLEQALLELNKPNS